MITILSGGTGTPKLIQGIKEIYPEEEITVIVNTVENLYMSRGYIAADIDTVMYTFADLIDEEFWYGIKGDTFIVREQLIEMGTTELLRLGDKDRATKLQKAILLEEGWTLSENKKTLTKEKSKFRLTHVSSSLNTLSILALSNAFNHEKRPTPFPPLSARYVESDCKNDLILFLFTTIMTIFRSNQYPLSDGVYFVHYIYM